MEQVYSPGDITRSGLCIGCGSCVALEIARGVTARMIFDKYGQYQPSGPAGWYNQSSKDFSSICPFSPTARNENDLTEILFQGQKADTHTGTSIVNYAGYVSEDEFRINASSGGMTSWVAAELFRKGLVDGIAHVFASASPQTDGKLFKYQISRNEEEIRNGARSRYYPIELSEVLSNIFNTPGKYAVIAVPCMIKAVHLLRMRNAIFHERICFTLGLFCGHMKSARFVESFARQMKIPVSEVMSIDFRSKRPDKPANWYNAKFYMNNGTEHNRDWWHMADGDWGAGFFMNNACNYCDDVTGETADVSFGDAWVKPYSSDGMGNNVVVVRSKVISDLIAAGIGENRLKLVPVSDEFVKETQAAGFRQRREGLSYRLTWIKKGIKPKKRVPPSMDIAKERKKIYRMRYKISEYSHKIFRFSKTLHAPWFYILWARLIASAYYGIVYHKGSIKAMKKRFDILMKRLPS
jgi:coenzyme F420-reducing hydrogenase beta subunit